MLRRGFPRSFCQNRTAGFNGGGTTNLVEVLDDESEVQDTGRHDCADGQAVSGRNPTDKLTDWFTCGSAVVATWLDDGIEHADLCDRLDRLPHQTRRSEHSSSAMLGASLRMCLSDSGMEIKLPSPGHRSGTGEVANSQAVRLGFARRV